MWKKKPPRRENIMESGLVGVKTSLGSVTHQPGSLMAKTTKQVLKNILSEHCDIEYAAQAVVHTIKQEFQRDGVPFEFDDRVFSGYASKLADLRLMHLLIGFFELEPYREILIVAEVERMFGVKLPSGAESIDKAQKALTDAASLLRAPDDSGGTPLDNRAERRARTQQRPSVPASGATNRTTAKQSPYGSAGASASPKVPRPR